MSAPMDASTAKTILYRAGWRWDRNQWCLLEKRKPGKTLHIEVPNWREALDWETKMRAASRSTEAR